MTAPTAPTAIPPQLFVWLLQDPTAPQCIGEIKRLNNGDVSLTYAASWLDAGFPLSADLPLVATEFPALHRHARQKAAPGAVDDARPDNWGEKVIRYLHKPRGSPVFDFLYLAGDDRFGALGVSQSQDSYQPFPTPVLPRLQDAQDLSDIAKIIASDGVLTAQQRHLAATNASLGGAKPKAIIAIDGEEWVLKLFSGEPVDLPLVEHATMTLAALCGIDVAATRPVRLAAEHAIAIQRFDRVGTARIHCISAATALRAVTPPGEAPRYGYPHLARVLRSMGDPKTVSAQLLDLFRRMVFNLLIANTDDHEKNHALLVRATGKRTLLTLSKAYDIVPTGSGAMVHEFLIGEDSFEPLLSQAMSVCQHFDLTPPQAAAEVAQIIQRVETWPQHFKQCGVTDHDLAELAQIIDRDDLVAQRHSFRASDYLHPAAKRKRTGPFA